MRFIYYYKTSDNVRHEAEISAPSRDEAFAALRDRGIRPIKMVQITVGEGIHSYRRVVSLVLFVVFVLLAGTAYWFGRVRGQKGESGVKSAKTVRIATARPRRVLPALSGGTPLTGTILRRIFAHPSEAYLACFAQPGVVVDWESDGDVTEILKEDLVDALDDEISIMADDSREVSELKRIVRGLKDEVSMLIASGRGVDEVCDWFEARQNMEVEYRNQVLDRVDSDEISEEEANSLLVSMGFTPIVTN